MRILLSSLMLLSSFMMIAQPGNPTTPAPLGGGTIILGSAALYLALKHKKKTM